MTRPLTPLVASPRLEAYKSDLLFSDADGNDFPSPGDTLLYTVNIQNVGNQAAAGVLFSDQPGGNTSLVTGTVQSSQGTVTSGNGPGDSTVGVNLGSIAGGQSVSITFRVTIDSPLPGNVTQVENQGLVSSTNATSEPTDDPDTAADDDSTVTPVTAAPLIEAFKHVSLSVDADGDGTPSPGDTLLYDVAILNNGNSAALGVTFSDQPGPYQTLIVGSVQTSQGTITDGNGSGDTAVGVSLGTLGGSGGMATVSFRTRVDSPLPAGVTSVSNQGVVTATNAPAEPTDDPTTPTEDDPTVVSLVAAPVIELFKSDSLYTDVDGNGFPSPGDLLSYSISIVNSGNQGATNVTLSDPAPPNTTIVAGSVLTSQGAVTSGNGAGDTVVSVSLGTLGGGQSATVTFRVRVNTPLPAGISSVSNQAVVTGDNFNAEPSDDPDTLNQDDPTTTPLALAPAIEAFKSARLFADADGNEQPSPGDTILYTIDIFNYGNQDGIVTFYDDLPDDNTAFVIGSVQASQGTITSGNGAGDTLIQVNIGTVPGGGGHASISYQITINDPLPAGVTTISNQGVVTGQNFPAEPTDDPATPTEDDSTITPVVAQPLLDASKRDFLFFDADGNGSASPGDTLLYNVTVQNLGNSAATSVIFSDTPGANLTLVSGSAQTSQGTVTSGNSDGDTSVSVSLGTLAGGGGTATVSFRVTIAAPLPGGVTTVANQGLVTADNTTAVVTDDPDSIESDDPTVTPITAQPLVELYKDDLLIVDADEDGAPSPGDTLIYQFSVQNLGNQNATGITLNDAAPPNTQLVVGSVLTSQGTVTAGNNPGDSTVVVELGALSGQGGSASVSFRVIVDSPLPPGVTSVENQGFISGTNFPTEPSDDPNTAGEDDPTITPLTAAPLIEAFKSDSLFLDADNNGIASPGDTLLYRVQVVNGGNSAATGVTFTDSPGRYTTLVAGSVSTSAGTVTGGNNPGDTTVTVAIGTLSGGGGSATIEFQARIESPLPAGVNQVANQGFVTGTNFATEPTDDSDTPAEDDPTLTPLTLSPVVEAFKSVVLFTDADEDGNPSPGDTLLYTVSIFNYGNQDAQVTFFDDLPDVNTALIIGSVQSTQGTITSGNSTGDSDVQVDIGTVPGGGASVSISYRVTINNPLPAGVTTITNQGLVTGANFAAEPTDDPTTPADDDPTILPLVAAPYVEAFKQDTIFNDTNSDGILNPGETLIYNVTIQNTGNQAAQGVLFTDQPDPNTTLVVGSVSTSQGTVTSGNTPGDSSVTVTLGTIPGQGGSVTVSFRVTLNNPLPAGVTRVSNQGFVSGDNFVSEPTEDPATPADDDPTVTPLSAAPLLEAFKSDTLLNDADQNGLPSPGDTLEYIVTVSNVGNQSATNTRFNDVLDANLTLVVGSVQTSQGTVSTGNATGDTAVSVVLGDLAGGQSATISFAATINSPLPAGVSQVANQGIVQADNASAEPTDDPSTPTDDDPTITSVVAAPLIEAYKRALLLTDADDDGAPSPGDTLLYKITIQNLGNSAAAGVIFTDVPGPNQTLQVGTVQASQGTITNGNTAGDIFVAVAVGTIAGGSEATIEFAVRINSPLPAGVNTVSNQGLVTGNNFPDEPTDDPTTPADDDPTITAVTAAPVIEAYKRVLLEIDANGDGIPSPGDTLLYKVTISNNGNGAATGVTFSDTPDPNTALVNGSVTTSQGAVILGNGAGDTSVLVNVGTLGGGQSVAIDYEVTVDSPFPAGVTQLANQGTVSGNNFANEPTDDPTTATDDDPTLVSINVVALGGVTFLDTDGDGVQDPNENVLIAGVPITVRDSNGNIVAEIVSDGSWAVYDLPPGTYFIEVGTVPGYTLTSPAVQSVTLAAGEQNFTVDFGFTQPTAVELSVFQAGHTEGGVLVEWVTTSEVDNDGFHLWRADAAEGEYVRLTDEPIASQAMPGGGAEYSFLDASAVAGSPYWYKLEFVPSGELVGPVATDGAPTAVTLGTLNSAPRTPRPLIGVLTPARGGARRGTPAALGALRNASA